MIDTNREVASKALLIAAFAAIYVIWGSTYLAIRIGIESLPPFLMAGTRFLAAGLPLYWILRARGTARPTWSHWRAAGLTGTLMLAGGNGLVTWAEQSIPSSIAAVVIATVPLWMTLLAAWPFGRARVSSGALVGLICGLAGVAVLVAPTGSDLEAVDPLAVCVLLLAAFSWSVGSLLSRSATLPDSPMMVAATQMTAGGAALLVWGSLAGEWATLDLSAVSTRSSLALIYLVTFGSIVALGAYAYLMRVTSAAAVSTYAFVNPVVAVGLGWAFAGEALGSRTVLATLLVLGAVVALQGSRWLPTLGRLRRAAPRPVVQAEAVPVQSCDRP